MGARRPNLASSCLDTYRTARTHVDYWHCLSSQRLLFVLNCRIALPCAVNCVDSRTSNLLVWLCFLSVCKAVVMPINKQSCAVSVWQLLLLLWKNFILQVLWTRKADSLRESALARPFNTCPLVSPVLFFWLSDSSSSRYSCGVGYSSMCHCGSYRAKVSNLSRNFRAYMYMYIVYTLFCWKLLSNCM